MGRFFSYRHIFPAAAVSLLCGFLQALPAFWGSASQSLLFSAARGLASSQKLSGYSPASLLDLWHGWLWNVGGIPLLLWMVWGLQFVGWSLLFFAVLIVWTWVVGRFVERRWRRRGLVALGGLLVLATCVPATWTALDRGEANFADLRLVAPIDLIAKVHAFDKGDVYSNPSTQAYLLLFSPALAGGVSAADARTLSLDPHAWRRALRENGWRAVILAGPDAEYGPLLRHLLRSRDWHLSAVTNKGFLFLRGPGSVETPIDIKKFALATDRETAIYLAEMAQCFDAIRQSRKARDCIERARKLAPGDVTVLAESATYAGRHKHWRDAIAYGKKVLETRPDFSQVQIVEALALVEIGEPDRAIKLVNDVLARNPDDLQTLFLAARINRVRHDYAREAKTLERIIALSAKEGLPVTDYQIYLGQAYARLGEAEPALKNYRAVLAQGRLTKEQAGEIQDAISTIESRTQVVP